jgi:hypothetical protein
MLPFRTSSTAPMSSGSARGIQTQPDGCGPFRWWNGVAAGGDPRARRLLRRCPDIPPAGSAVDRGSASFRRTAARRGLLAGAIDIAAECRPRQCADRGKRQRAGREGARHARSLWRSSCQGAVHRPAGASPSITRSTRTQSSAACSTTP